MLKKLTVTFIALITISIGVSSAESLFTLGATANYGGVPKSLFGGVQARQVGDLISIIMSENVRINDSLEYSSTKSSTTQDSFTSYIKNWLGLGLKTADGYGGSNDVSTSADGSRQMTFNDNIAVQVVQQLPNGNLSVQGKKTVINGNERMDFIVTGIVDPRWINTDGQVYSYNVANLQFALSGRGSISRSQNEGLFNRFVKYLF